MPMTYACMHTIPATGATITMVAPGQFRLTRANAQARRLMREHGYTFGRKLRLWE